MPNVRFEGQAIPLESGETVLDGLLRAGRAVPHSCKAGACHSCLVRAVDGPAPHGAQFGLSPTLQTQGYFLACLARPEDDLTVDRGGEGLQKTRARVESLDRLSSDVLRLRLVPKGDFEYRPGQFLTLIRPDGLARSYSIASLPARGPSLELHVRVYPEGRMGLWLDRTARPGDEVTIQGPSGHCFYDPGDQDQGLVLAGTGTGLAPLYGIVLDAIEQGHRGPITLFHGARGPGGLYLDGPLRELQARHAGFEYHPCCLEPEGRVDVAVGRLEDALIGRFPSFSGRRVYLCGNPEMVRSLRKLVFLKGAGMKEILADLFLASPPPVS